MKGNSGWQRPISANDNDDGTTPQEHGFEKIVDNNGGRLSRVMTPASRNSSSGMVVPLSVKACVEHEAAQLATCWKVSEDYKVERTGNEAPLHEPIWE